MFGAFKPSAPLSGGLLWKTPWRLSPHQKLRHRRRLRRVDNVVTVLDTALQRAKATSDLQSTQPPPSETPDPDTSSIPGNATASELRTTAEGQRLLNSFKPAVIALETRRHGRGPRQGEFLPNGKLLRDAAAEAGTMKLLVRWKSDMPTEQEMLPKDKYSIFDKKVRGYRKSVHKLPKWTRVSQRLNPPGF
ncbi:related to ribosomal protein YmL31 precursor [Ramularia collo-cygni]|uniref:Related to ribosomal protein YmL31 n=1 Tax=Ramularia collo-cygni TaxID=112498 RepID=A0A2D3VGP0_9PEZI|nr:related to ribosomal protein YmL31 precursor [Ramularia collo-cygni]CZT25175.1 related to ribosomal protein YmL31 precursor [Ramularia collo-cygni]